MYTNPYLPGAIAAEARMNDARREAERYRLVKATALEPWPRTPRNWLKRLGRRLRRNADDRAQPGHTHAGYGTPAAASRAKA